MMKSKPLSAMKSTVATFFFCCVCLSFVGPSYAQRLPRIQAEIQASMPLPEQARATVQVDIRGGNEPFEGYLHLVHSIDGKPPIIYLQRLDLSPFAAKVVKFTPCLGNNYFETLQALLISENEQVLSVNIPWRTALDEQQSEKNNWRDISRRSMKDFSATHPQRPSTLQVLIFSMLYLFLTLTCFSAFKRGRKNFAFFMLFLWFLSVIYSTGIGRDTARNQALSKESISEANISLVNLYFGSEAPVAFTTDSTVSVRFDEKSGLHQNIEKVIVALDRHEVKVIPNTSGTYGQLLLYQ